MLVAAPVAAAVAVGFAETAVEEAFELTFTEAAPGAAGSTGSPLVAPPAELAAGAAPVPVSSVEGAAPVAGAEAASLAVAVALAAAGGAPAPALSVGEGAALVTLAALAALASEPGSSSCRQITAHAATPASRPVAIPRNATTFIAFRGRCGAARGAASIMYGEGAFGSPPPYGLPATGAG